MTRFASLGELRAACLDLPIGDAKAAAVVAAREAALTKPPRSLGRLEEAVAWLASWQGASRPHLDNVEILVFAGNHGVTAQGVSAYPAAVTAQMVANFASGGAAINQLARADGAELRRGRARPRCPDGGFHEGARHGRGRVSRRGRRRSQRALARRRSGGSGRDGHRQYDRSRGDRGGFVRRRRRALRRPRHWRR